MEFRRLCNADLLALRPSVIFLPVPASVLHFQTKEVRTSDLC
jgi:hypothetical protein